MINPYSIVVDAVHITDMYEAYVTYVDDEDLDNHDYDNDTDDDKVWRRRDLLPAGWLAGRGTLTLSEKIFDPNHPGFLSKKS